MQAIVTAGWGPHTRLVLAEKPAPVAGANDVLVAVHAASVNPKDWKLNLNAARLATPLGVGRLPPLFGDDLAGVVLATGKDVTDLQVGDTVYGMDMRPRTATLAEQAVIARKRIARAPDSVSLIEAAGVPLAGLTALQGLRKGQAAAGKSVLIIGAAGGVGTFALQIAKAMGCAVTAVCSGRNAELVRELGADTVIDYTQGDFRAAAGGPFDLVFDVTSYETPASCAGLLAAQGFFISTGGTARAHLGLLRTRNPRAQGITVESYSADLDTLRTWIDGGQIRPIIDSVFPLAEAEQAYARSRSGRARGKIVIRVQA